MLPNITTKKTRRAYKIDVGDFSAFAGLTESSQLRSVTRVPALDRLAYIARELASFASYTLALFSQNEIVAGS